MSIPGSFIANVKSLQQLAALKGEKLVKYILPLLTLKSFVILKDFR
jgi:hypothetical protein